MKNLKEQIKKTLWMKLPPKVVFPKDCVTIEDRLAYRRMLVARSTPDDLRNLRYLPIGSPYSLAINECQYKFIFRELYFHTYDEDPQIRPDRDVKHPTRSVLKRLAHQKLNATRYHSMLLQSSPRHMAQVVIARFYSRGHFAWWPVIHAANNEIDRNVLADLLLGAMGPPRINPEWKTSTVMCIIKGMRATEDFTAMPILSDALQDAGCEDESLLSRLRESAYFSLGDWLFKATGMIG